MFNQFEIKESYSAITDNVDPDTNFFNDVQQGYIFRNSDYYFENSFNEAIDKIGITHDTFSVLHVNIRSAPKNLTNYMAYISNLKHNITVIAMSETWLKDMNVDIYSIDGYSHVYDYRYDWAGGGVSSFMKEGIEYVRRNDLSVFNQDIESLFVEITNVRSSCGKSNIGKNSWCFW